MTLWRGYMDPHGETLKFANLKITLGSTFELFGKEWKYEKWLGSGGFGRVIQAVDEDGNRAAIKFFSSTDALEVAKPSIHARREYGESDIVVDYMSDIDGAAVCTEFVDGVPVNRVVIEREYDRVTLERFIAAIVVVRDLFKAVLQGEENGVFHRDIKQENILLQEGECDFGVCKPESLEGIRTFRNARLCDLDILANERTIQDDYKKGFIRGNPLYMSPERTRGIFHKYMERWSIGRVGKEVLVGGLHWRFICRDYQSLAEHIAFNGVRKLYSREQVDILESLGDMKKNPQLAPVEKAAKNVLRILNAFESMDPNSRLSHLTSVEGLMKEIFQDGNLIAV